MKKTAIILLHTGYWMLYLLLVSSFIVAMPQGFKHPSFPGLLQILFLSSLTTHVVFPGIVGFYSFYFFLFPRFLNRRKIPALVLYAVLLSVICALLAALATIVLFGNGGWNADNDWSSTLAAMSFLSLLSLVHGSIGLVMRGFITWYGDIRLKEDLNKMELALIKSQISPHFLFNTINNIDVLITKDPAKASGYLNKLSDIMRFMLYETKDEMIPLSKELLYIGKYIELQKIRTSNPNYVRFSTQGETEHINIAPMLFIPFVENAFKHAETNKKTDSAVNIRFVIEPGMIIFECENVFTADAIRDKDHGGLGNELIRKRLALLYPGRHQLKVVAEQGNYSVNLIIEQHAN